MMVYPSVNEVMDLRDIKSKYSLVIIVAKRAREIVESGVSFTECASNKPVSIAVNEIFENKVSFRTKEDGEKSEDSSAVFMTETEDNTEIEE